MEIDTSNIKVLKEERNIEVTDEGKIRMSLDLVEEYEPVNVMNMVESWRSSVDKSQGFVDGIEETINLSKGEIERRLMLQLDTVKKDLANTKKSLENWEPTFDKWVKQYPRKYEQLLNDRAKQLKKKTQGKK